MDEKRLVNKKLLRCGYTTGSCASAAAKAAALALLTGETPSSVSISTPMGKVLTLDTLLIARDKDFAKFAVRKDSGDDPDITNGILVCAEPTRALPYSAERAWARSQSRDWTDPLATPPSTPFRGV